MNPPLSNSRLSKFAFIGLFLPFFYCCKYQIAISPPWKKESPTQNQSIEFVKSDYLAQIDLAKTSGKPVFIDFYTDWCGPCRVMDRDVFRDGKMAAFFNKHFINLKINAEKGEGIALAKQYGISAYPTLLFLDAQGAETKRVVGISTASKLVKIGKKIKSE